MVQPVMSTNAPAGTTPGTVFSMSPGPGTNAQSGATITIQVAAAANHEPADRHDQPAARRPDLAAHGLHLAAHQPVARVRT